MKCYEIIGLGSTTNRTIAYRRRTAINCFQIPVREAIKMHHQVGDALR